MIKSWQEWTCTSGSQCCVSQWGYTRGGPFRVSCHSFPGGLCDFKKISTVIILGIINMWQQCHIWNASDGLSWWSSGQDSQCRGPKFDLWLGNLDPTVSLARRRAVPFPPRPRRPGNPTTKQFCRGEAASGNHGAPVEAGAVLQGTGGSIPISISAPPLLLRCLPGFLLSCCQLGSADRSELLPARTNRKAWALQPTEGGAGEVEPDSGKGGEACAQPPGKCSSSEWHPSPTSRKWSLWMTTTPDTEDAAPAKRR